MRSRLELGLALGLTALLGLPAAGVAQSLQGDVTDSSTHHVVSGGMIVLLGRADSVMGSTTTTERGTFGFGSIAAGSYRLRVLRIGSKAWLSPSFTIAVGQSLVRHLFVASEPVMLADIVVTASSACRADLASNADVATLWEEARKALALANGAKSGPRLEYRMTVATRHTDATGELSTEERLGRIGTGAWPIRSAPAQSLLDRGYVQPADSVRGPRYYGPDAEVFFSDAFQRTHCFRAVGAPRKSPNLIGVGFEPERSRVLPDIKGVMWLDRTTAELTRIEFEYTGLWRWVPPNSTGGRLDFIRLPSGTWIINSWRMTAPIAAVEPLRLDARADESVFPYFGNKRVKLGGFLEEEGWVEEVRGADSTVIWREAKTR